MKKILKKQIAIIILIMLLLPIFTTLTYAVNDEKTIQVMEKSEAFEKWEKLDEEDRENSIEPLYFDIGLKDSVKRSTYNQYLRSTSELDGDFNLAEQLKTISPINVKNQQATGACWAFSYSSVIETTIANKYNRAVMEYSPMHIDYVTATKFNRVVGDGGTQLMALAYSASGVGPVYESDFAFESVYDEENNSSNPYYLSSISDVVLNQESRARIEESNIFASIYKTYTTDSTTYQTSDGTDYTADGLKATRNLIKTHIQENGAVLATFFCDLGTTEDNQTASENGYYNSGYTDNNEYYASYYCNDSEATVNHAVTIVGWDDSFKKEYFSDDVTKRPLNDGAYIVLNSWGTEFGDNGYFYVSYDDATIEESIIGISEIVEKENEQDKFYDYIYEYDELGVNNALSYGDESIYGANVFTRQNAEGIEYLSEVGIFLMSTHGIEIYVNSVDGDLNNCELVGTYTGNDALEAGYHTLKLASPVELTGDKFVVKIKYINSDGAYIPIECDLYESNFSYISTAYDTATSNEGESYMSVDGTTWSDLYNLKVGLTQTLKDTNACIKAFTTLSEGDTTVEVTSVTLDKETVVIKEGETASLVATVLPENATNKGITWSSDNENVATIENGVITGITAGTATITVTTQEGNLTDTCTVTVEEAQTAPDTVAVTGVTLDKETVTIKEGETASLVATVLPENATNQGITWSSDNENVATIENGVITGVTAGTATITVTTQDGNLTDTCTVTVEQAQTTPDTVSVTGVTLDKETVTIKEGETASLVATVLPENATNQGITWSSDNENVATIENGVITGVTAGTATITVTTQDGNLTDTCTVTVEQAQTAPDTVAVTGVTLDKEAVTVKIGGTASLVATVLPENATNKGITWTSDNENVATIENGVITGVAAGTATITVTTKEGDFTDTCTVTVEEEVSVVKVTGIELNKTTLDMQVGDEANLVATIKPINATNKNVTWKSSNPEVATISENGIIEAVKEGKTTITVTSKDGGYTASCEITVSAKTNSDDDIYKEEDKQPGKIEPAGDMTVAKDELPKAGAKAIITIVLMTIIVAIIVYKKYKTFEDIK